MRSERGIGILFAAFGLASLAAFGLSTWFGPKGWANDWLLLILGLAMAGAGVRMLTDRSPKLILGDAAFACTLGNSIQIHWTDIADVQSASHKDVTYLILRLADPAAEPQPPTLWNRPTFDRPPGAADHDIVLPISGLDASPEYILGQIRARIAAAHHVESA